MFRLAIYEYIHSFRRNVITVLQLIFIMVLIIVLSSTLFSQTGLYNLFCEREANAKGVLALNISEEVIDSLSGVEKAIYGKTTFMSYIKEDRTLQIHIYDEAMSRYIQPVVEEGVWVDSIFANNEYPCFVIFPNKLGIKPGDTITIDDYNGNTSEIFISGILSPDQYIYAGNKARGLNPRETDYTTLVNKYPDANNPDDIVLVTTEKEMAKINGEIYYTCGNGVIKYKNDITNEEMESNEKLIKDYVSNNMGVNSGSIKLCTLQQFYDNSLKRVNAVLITYIPIMIAVVGLIMSSILGYEYLCNQKAICNYSIYYMLGVRWERISMISSVRNIINFLISYAISFGIFYIVELLNINKYIFITFRVSQHLLIILIGIVFILFGAFIPYRMLKKVTPDEVIRNVRMQ
ncbi:MAG: hypothetical protein IJC76_08580 [Lachnospiraceae bacterium]|nr:hypothetical protein [Lachnospiraceae bacterium]